MARKISDEVQNQREAVRLRVEWVLNHVFAGKQRRMAAAMGQDQAYLSRIVNGHQGVGPDFLAALARLPDLNPAWVLEGRGEPLFTPTRGTLPVSPFVLPGPPLTCPQLLTGTRHMAAEALERDSRYWLQVQDQWPMVQLPVWKIMAADLLLMETSLEWTRRLDLALGRFCGVRLRPQSPTPYVVGKLEQDGGRVVLRTGAEVAWLDLTPPPASDASEPASSEMSLPPPTHQFGKRLKRRIRNLDDERARADERRQQRDQTAARRQQEQQERGQVEDTFTIDDITCICVYLVRATPAS